MRPEKTLKKPGLAQKMRPEKTLKKPGLVQKMRPEKTLKKCLKTTRYHYFAKEEVAKPVFPTFFRSRHAARKIVFPPFFRKANFGRPHVFPTGFQNTNFAENLFFQQVFKNTIFGDHTFFQRVFKNKISPRTRFSNRFSKTKFSETARFSNGFSNTKFRRELVFPTGFQKHNFRRPHVFPTRFRNANFRRKRVFPTLFRSGNVDRQPVFQGFLGAAGRPSEIVQNMLCRMQKRPVLVKEFAEVERTSLSEDRAPTKENVMNSSRSAWHGAPHKSHRPDTLAPHRWPPYTRFYNQRTRPSMARTHWQTKAIAYLTERHLAKQSPAWTLDVSVDKKVNNLEQQCNRGPTTARGQQTTTDDHRKTGNSEIAATVCKLRAAYRLMHRLRRSNANARQRQGDRMGATCTLNEHAKLESDSDARLASTRTTGLRSLMPIATQRTLLEDRANRRTTHLDN